MDTQKLASLVFADTHGKIFNHPFLKMAAQTLQSVTQVTTNNLIQLPEGSTLFYLPQRTPIGFNPQSGHFELLPEYEGKPVFAVGAFLIPAYLRLLNPAGALKEKKILPQWAYTACGYKDGRFYVAATRVDPRRRQSPHFYESALIKKKVSFFLTHYKKNRLYRHLANCALNHNCLAAKNLFMERWEAPMPTAQHCNARCLGCLSMQAPASDCIASHARIQFRPTVKEMIEVMGNHLSRAREAIVSFGQGCEGEPLMEADSIAKAIACVRRFLSRGTINMNTNASLPNKVRLLCDAGIDSFRVSLNSPNEKYYNIYFRPRGYRYSDVMRSIAIAKRLRKFVSVNLFVFPGFTDAEKEVKGLFRFINNTGIDMIQWRNLNIDPDYYKSILSYPRSSSMGIKNLLTIVRKRFPKLKMGYFNLPKEKFDTFKIVVK